MERPIVSIPGVAARDSNGKLYFFRHNKIELNRYGAWISRIILDWIRIDDSLFPELKAPVASIDTVLDVYTREELSNSEVDFYGNYFMGAVPYEGDISKTVAMIFPKLPKAWHRNKEYIDPTEFGRQCGQMRIDAFLQNSIIGIVPVRLIVRSVADVEDLHDGDTTRERLSEEERIP